MKLKYEEPVVEIITLNNQEVMLTVVSSGDSETKNFEELFGF